MKKNKRTLNVCLFYKNMFNIFYKIDYLFYCCVFVFCFSEDEDEEEDFAMSDQEGVSVSGIQRHT